MARSRYSPEDRERGLADLAARKRDDERRALRELARLAVNFVGAVDQCAENLAPYQRPTFRSYAAKARQERLERIQAWQGSVHPNQVH